MNREQIDELLNASVREDEEKILQVVFQVTGIKKEDVNSLGEEDYIRLMEEIKGEDFEYFVSKLKDSEFKEIVLGWLHFISNEKRKEVMKIITRDDSEKDNSDSKIISKEYKDAMEPMDIAYLMKIIQNIEFTKINLKDGKNFLTGRGETDANIRKIYIELLRNNETDFIEECIENPEEYGIGGYFLVELMKETNNIKAAENLIKRIKETEEYNRYDLKGLVNLTKDSEFVKYIIEQFGNWNGKNFENVFDLIIATENNYFIKDCICESKKIDDLTFISLIDYWTKGEVTYRKSNLDSIEDIEILKACLKKLNKLKLNIDDVEKKLDELGDDELTKQCILNGGLSKEGISSRGFSKDFIKRKLDELRDYDKEFSEFLIKNRYELEIGAEKICEIIKKTTDKGFEKIKIDSLYEILSMEDADYIKTHLLENIILKNINSENVDIDGINEEIEKVYEIFLTNDLPNNFKYFEFFKNHQSNHNSNNEEFYPENDKEKRDKIIAGDLFRTLLESDNIKMKSFLENLYNGNMAINENEGNEIREAVLLKYRDILYELLDAVEPNKISKTEDYNKDLDEIRKYLNAEEKDDLGEIILLKYFENIGLDYKKDEKPLIKTLLEYIDIKKQEAKNNNTEEFILEEGDLIKGTDIIYLEDVLQNGIRAKEFLMVGEITSDATPLDTDFSEIAEENLKENNLESILNSTFSKESYGKTYFVIKKENYENDERSYSEGTETEKTRYFRTAMGATNISAIITTEWNDEYKYVLAKNGFYIPVINKEDGKVLFTKEEYEKIRESMQGLSHYGINDFVLDKTASNTSVEEQAKELREKAKGKVSTEEKREKVIDKIRKNIGKLITTEMLGDISGRFLELIDTGSTGRGTNIPGDGDFDFMLKCKDKEEQSQMIAKIKTFIEGKDKGGTNELNIRYTDVEIEGLNELVEVDVTTESKKLSTEYSSDMAVKDRLSSIQRKYGDEGLKTVVDNIIVAKKILKENGVYKKANSVGGTEFGGFGGIGVENWILQNGGSFVKAMQTFLENTIDENGKELSFEEFKNRYPIYDFGQNHRDTNNQNHDHFIEGLTLTGFDKLKEVCREQLELLGEKVEEKNDEKEQFTEEVLKFTEDAKGYRFSDMTQIYSLLARFRTYEMDKENNNRGEVEE